MFELVIRSKSSLDNVHKRMKNAFNNRGIRIGKEINVSQELLAEILGVRDYNTLAGLVTADHKQQSDLGSVPNLREPYLLPELPNTTYAGRDLVIQHLKDSNPNSIQEVLLVVAKEGANNGALIVIIVENNMTRVLRTLITAERKAREIECLQVIKELTNFQLISRTRYINIRFEYGFFDLSPSEMNSRIIETETKLLIDDPQGFLALFNTSLERVPLDYYFDEWSKL